MMAEMRMIDANALVEKLKAHARNAIARGEGDPLSGLRTALLEIAYSLTVDAVPVVRCKDCIYVTAKYGDLYCNGPTGIFGTVVFNDFCSCGEREEE